MTRLISAVVGSAALLLAGCGGEAGSEASAERELTFCLPTSEFDISLAPIDLSTLELSPVSVGGIGITMSFGGMSLPGPSPITITARSNTQTSHLARQTVAKDGITPGSSVGTVNIGTPDTENCTTLALVTVVAGGIPDHPTGSFPNAENPYAITRQTRELSVDVRGDLSLVPIALTPDRLDGILFNGVPIQMREASCAGTQCSATGGDANPLHAPALYGIDTHNAHVLSDGSYHYHGDPHTLYDDSGTRASPVIGFAADGVPIFGPWIDDSGVIRRATSSYQLKTGNRPEPDDSFSYDGTFVEDYEYVHASGDLDICNGMFIGGVYGYVVTDTFPYTLNCLRREPDPSFNLD